MSAFLTRIGDRLNPVLVKEVRQALNGRLFRIGYGLSLLAALCIAMVMVMSSEQPDGAQLSVAMFGCMGVSLFAFIPFWSFLSMGGEWDENTHDLLVLSNLSPRRIVLGKLGAALVQSLVSFLAFLPFFVFAFLLRGVNLPTLLMLLGAALVVSPCAALVAIGISSLTTNRFLRVLLMVGVIAGLIVLAIGAVTFVGYLLFTGFFTPAASEQLLVLAVILTVALVVGGFFGEVACVRLAHAEENRSTGLRVLALAGLAGMVAWTAYGVSQGADLDFVSGMAIAAQWLLLLPCAHFAIETEPLGRRVARQVPRNRLLALLATPLLPGGGRGLLFWFACEALVLGGATLVATQVHGATGAWSRAPIMITGPAGTAPTVLAPPTIGLSGALDAWWNDGLWSVLATGLFCAFYLAVPTLIVRRTTSPMRRLRARLSVLLLFAGGIALPALVLFLQSGPRHLPGWSDPWEHAFNPFWLLDEAWNDAPFDVAPLGTFTLLVVATIALLLLLPRARRGLAEVAAASAERRARERKGDAPPAS